LIGPYMKAEIGQTDQIFQLGYNKYPVQSKEIIKFNIWSFTYIIKQIC